MSFTAPYSQSEAQQCMTLSAIAYASENDPTGIQAAIISNLANTNFATGGNWSLVWLGLTSDNENLVYVAQDTTQSARYAVVVRGTDWCFLVNFQEDFTVDTQVQPGFGPSTALVSTGAMDGLTDITTVTAVPIAGGNAVTFLGYLQNQYAAGGFDTFDVFVTGHSLGGCLASITFPWLIANATSNWSSVSDLNVKAYTFAAPTAGNLDFANYVTGLGATNPYYYWSVVNPDDIAPYAWGDLLGIFTNNVPVETSFEIRFGLVTLLLVIISTLGDVSYAQPGSANTQTLTNDLDFSSTCGTPPVRTVSDYFCWVGNEHEGDTYLTLLGATPTNITTAPSCPAATIADVSKAGADPKVQELLARWKKDHPSQA